MSDLVTTLIGDYIEQPATMFQQGLFQESSTKKHKLGTFRWLDDGRKFVYCKAGAVALDPAKLVTYITTATKEGPVAVAATQYSRQVTITAAGVSANDFEDGWLVVAAGTGIGEAYKIRSNTATSGGTITVNLYDAIATAWSTTDTYVALYPSPYNAVVVNPTDAQQKPVAVPWRSITAEYYFWGQVSGKGPLKMDVNAAAGQELDEKQILASTNHAGQGMLTTTPANADMKHIVGYVIEEADITDNYVALVELTL